ncbi:MULTISPECIES: hypothetical protein [unclassified Kitasatospora]|uniref:hypothetical protein n=1 Tax=unclassified Kitasatospora TaxID=2633591 RepID=UPI002476E5F9|nr:hypothetical protein [Kitasatospora sp. MAP12-44]
MADRQLEKAQAQDHAVRTLMDSAEQRVEAAELAVLGGKDQARCQAVVGVTGHHEWGASHVAHQIGAAWATTGLSVLLLDNSMANDFRRPPTADREPVSEESAWQTLWADEEKGGCLSHLSSDNVRERSAPFQEPPRDSRVHDTLHRAKGTFDYILAYDEDQFGFLGLRALVDTFVVIAHASNLPTADSDIPRRQGVQRRVELWLDTEFCAWQPKAKVSSKLRNADDGELRGAFTAHIQEQIAALWGPVGTEALRLWVPPTERGNAVQAPRRHPLSPTESAAVLRDRHLRPFTGQNLPIAGLVATVLSFSPPVSADYEEAVRKEMQRSGIPILGAVRSHVTRAAPGIHRPYLAVLDDSGSQEARDCLAAAGALAAVLIGP